MQRLHYEEAGVVGLGLAALIAFVLIALFAVLMGGDAAVTPPVVTIPDRDAVAAMTGDSTGDASRAPVRVGVLPPDVRESSGIAHSRLHPAVWWTHNDGPDARAFAMTVSGTLLGTWRLEGPAIHDIEDIAAAPCPGGQPRSCLYLADTGDNRRDRKSYVVYVVEEPDVDPASAPSDGRLRVLAENRFSYGGHSRDAEAIAVLEDGTTFVITKGQEEGPELFRLPPLRRSYPGARAEAVAATSVGMLPLDADHKRNRVTAAAIAPSGTRLAVRSDAAVTLFEWPGLRKIGRCPLGDSGQQGEAVDFEDDSTLILTFESARSEPAPIYRLRCPAT